MRLGWRTKAILEYLLLGGFETLEALSRLRSPGLFYAAYSNDSETRRQLSRMEESGLVEIERSSEKTEWIVKLTAKGKGTILDDLDPEAAWSMEWDQRWTAITFDIPAKEPIKRHALNQWLQKRRFGHMQGSVWASHRSQSDIANELRQKKVSLSWVTIIVGDIVSSKSHRTLAHEIWNFETINSRYQDYLKHLEQPVETGDDSSITKDWFLKESQLWQVAFGTDPFLPNSLLPTNYLGKEAWNKRKALFATRSALAGLT